MTKKCVTLPVKDMDELPDRLKTAIEYGTEALELRLDWLKTVDVSILPKIKELHTEHEIPMILALRPERFKGKFEGEDKDRIAFFLEAAKLGFDYLELERDIEPELIESVSEVLRENEGNLIISHYDFILTPPAYEIINDMKKGYELGALMSKVCYYTRDYEDTASIIEACIKAKTKRYKYSAFGTGDYGVETLIQSQILGCEFCYCALDEDLNVYPGQIDIMSLSEAWEDRTEKSD